MLGMEQAYFGSRKWNPSEKPRISRLKSSVNKLSSLHKTSGLTAENSMWPRLGDDHPKTCRLKTSDYNSNSAREEWRSGRKPRRSSCRRSSPLWCSGAPVSSSLPEDTAPFSFAWKPSARRWFLRWWWYIIVVNISRRPFICILRIGSRSCASMHIQWVFNCFCETWLPPPAPREDVVYSYGCDSRLCVDPQTDFPCTWMARRWNERLFKLQTLPLYLPNEFRDLNV